jgi:hypothetical protein
MDSVIVIIPVCRIKAYSQFIIETTCHFSRCGGCIKCHEQIPHSFKIYLIAIHWDAFSPIFRDFWPPRSSSGFGIKVFGDTFSVNMIVNCEKGSGRLYYSSSGYIFVGIFLLILGCQLIFSLER